MPNDWWRHAVIYQIYPRSFLDTNHDGIGDLPGIIKKLDYIKDLGVDAIWVSPFFPSPMKDFGYDVSDYRDVDPMFGTLKDIEELLDKSHKKGIKVIIDLVFSHTSDQHPWFKDPEKKDWYVWADPKEDGSVPNNWVSLFGGPAWEWNVQHQQYYLHNFLTEQPDLNFHNLEVQTEVLDICKFWFDRGVDGFRLDVVNFYFHDQKLRDNPPRTDHGYATQFEGDTPYSAQSHIYDKSRPENLEFLEKIRDLADSYKSRFLMGEIGDDNPYERTREYTKPKRLHTSYNTDMMCGTKKELTESFIRSAIETFFTEQVKQEKGWPTWAFSNHDVVRAASRWYALYEHNPDFSKLLIALLGCMPGTLCLYQGEELGLPEAEIPFNKICDPWAKETWPEWQGRDGCRTPMPWLLETHINQWLPTPISHLDLNVVAQQCDTKSTLTFTQNFLKWRKNNRDIFKLNFEVIKTSHSKIIHFLYKADKNETNCIFNLSNKKISYKEHTYEPYSFAIDGFSNKP